MPSERRRHLATRGLTLVIGAGLAMSASAQTCEPDSFSLLNQWSLGTPFPIILLRAFGVLCAAGVLTISAHFFLVPENDAGRSEQE